MATYNIYEAKANFSKLVDEARRGNDVVIAKAGEPIVRMVAMEKEKRPKRQFGQNFLGITYIAPDFYDDLPLDLFDALKDEGDGQR